MALTACRWPNGSQTQPRTSSAFGLRPSPGSGGSTMHKGTDFPNLGILHNIADGVVKVVGTPGGWSGGGRQVWVQHDGFYSRHMHMASYNVRVGQSIGMGHIIGSEDSTGAATGPHDHLEIGIGQIPFTNSGQIDPVPFIAARVGVGSPAGTGSQDWVVQMQTDLNTVGYPTTADGDYGPATKASVEAFQRDQGLTVDGDAGPITLGRLKAVVEALQADLIAVGYPLTKDGKSGPQTIGAVKDFQGKNNLTVDGIAGPQTRAALSAKVALPTGQNLIPEKRSTADIQIRVGIPADKVDGVYGPMTTEYVMNFQRANPPLVVDGSWGDASDAVGFPKTSYVPIALTGIFDKATWQAIQASLGFTGDDVDGDPGKITITALQTAVGVPVNDRDGVLGPQTWRYVQAAVGVHQDGNPGPDTATAVQTMLNAGGRFAPGVVIVEPVKEPYPQPTAPTYPGATRWGHAWKSSNREIKPKQLFIWHYWGTDPVPSNDAEWDYFMRENDPNGSSCNWQINPDGSVFEPVPEDNYRAWTTGQIDHIAGTAEVGTATGAAGGFKFSAASLESLARVFEWHSRKWGYPLQKGEVGPNNEVIRPGLVGHNETPAGKKTGTPCPGPGVEYAWVIARAQEIRAAVVPVEPVPDPEPEPPESVEIGAHEAEEMFAAATYIVETLGEALDR